MADNLFDDLKKSLQELKDLLASKRDPIRAAVQALKGLKLPIDDLIKKLITLLGELKTEIDNLDLSNVPALGEVSTFTGSVRSLLDAAEKLLPKAADEIGAVRRVADVVSSLPSLDEVKKEITDLIDAIVEDLKFVNG
jgi:ABC-type transporter Mla subunit MlaD